MNSLEMRVAFETNANIIDLLDKPMTDDIYYYLNLAQTRYLADIVDEYKYNLSGVVLSKLGAIQPLLTSTTVSDVVSNDTALNIYEFALPVEFAYYVASSSVMTSTIVSDALSTSNFKLWHRLVDNTTVNNTMSSNGMNSFPILRTPYTYLKGKDVGNLVSVDQTYVIGIICGQYAFYNTVAIDVDYIKRPTILTEASPTTECSFATIVHNDIVNLAVELFLNSHRQPNKA